MKTVIDKVTGFIDLHALIDKHDRLLLSVSAGKDSMFLFNVLFALRDRYTCDIGIFHLNHMVRGADANSDEIHVKTIAEKHGIDYYLEKHDFSIQSLRGESFEEYARNVRYRLLHEKAAEHGYNKIVTAHTRDDDIETILMRIFTGTGIYGLRGIPPKRGMIIRPLLSVSAAEIYDFLKSENIEWREDRTNADSKFSRNFIRNEMLPLARKQFPMLESSISSLREVASETLELLDSLLCEKYQGTVDSQQDMVFIDAARFIDDRPAFCHVVASVIRNHFEHHVNKRLLHDLYSKFSTCGGNSILFHDGRILAKKVFHNGKPRLKISRIDGHEAVPVDWEEHIPLNEKEGTMVHLPGIDRTVSLEIHDYAYYEKIPKNNHSIFVTLENNIDTVYIRNRRRGDRIKTESGTKKLKDLFNEKKFENTEKNLIPILVIGTNIAAVMPGLMNDTPNRVSSDFLVDKKSKKVLVVISCR